MSLDCRVRESIQEEAKGIVAPPDLKEKVIVQIKMKHGGSKRKKRLIAGVLAAALLIPTTGLRINLLWRMVYTDLSRI